MFVLGNWTDYQQLEDSLSMPELIATLSSYREIEHRKNKFLAAIQGIELEDNTPTRTTFEDIKARVFSGGAAKDANDVLSLQGINAQQAGFGIGMGLEYTDAKNLENPTW